MTVTPVRTSSPSIRVVMPTRTPSTSVTAFFRPGVHVPIEMPRSLALTAASRRRRRRGRRRAGAGRAAALDGLEVHVRPATAHVPEEARVAVVPIEVRVGFERDARTPRDELCEHGGRLARGAAPPAERGGGNLDEPHRAAVREVESVAVDD